MTPKVRGNRFLRKRLLAGRAHPLVEFRSFLWIHIHSSMKKTLFVAFAALTSAAFAQPPAKIDVSQLPQQSKMIDDVVVPVPSEIFAVLDKLGKPHWAEVLRPMVGVAKPKGERPQVALLLGTVIAEGFIAVEAENSEEVKKIGNSVLSLAEAIGVRKAVLKRSKSIIDAADRKDWTTVRRELQGALSDVEEAMDALNSQELSQLVSLGGWVRGTEALTAVVRRDFTKDGAELLHQPVLLDYFDRRLENMAPRLKSNPVIAQMQAGLKQIRPLMGAGENAEISKTSVEEIGKISEGLIKQIDSKPQVQ